MSTKRVSKFILSFFMLFLCIGVSQAQVELATEFFFPQIVDGRADNTDDDDDVFRTIVVLQNPDPDNAAQVNLELSLFSVLDDTPVDIGELSFRCLEVGGPCASQFDILAAADLVAAGFMIPANGMVSLMTSRTNPVQVQGFARVMSDIGIGGMAIFGQFEEEIEEDEDEVEIEVEIEGQAAVQATGRMQRFAVADFRRNELEIRIGENKFEFESESSTGLAVANVGGADTMLQLRLFNAAGVSVGTAGPNCTDFDMATRTCSIALEAGGHAAFFIEEFISVNQVVGTLIAESTTSDVTAVALKFDEELDDIDEEERFEFTVAPVIRIE